MDVLFGHRRGDNRLGGRLDEGGVDHLLRLFHGRHDDLVDHCFAGKGQSKSERVGEGMGWLTVSAMISSRPRSILSAILIV